MELTPVQKAVDSICYACSVVDKKTEEDVVALIERLEREAKREANDFIREIAKLLGEDDLGHDGKSWAIDDFKNAIMDSSKRTTEKEQERFEVWAKDDGLWLVHGDREGINLTQPDKRNLQSMIEKLWRKLRDIEIKEGKE